MKNIAYVPYTPFPCIPGTHVTVAGVMWTALMPCTVIGHTVKEQVPVLKAMGDEPRLNEGELVKGKYTGVVDGQSLTEARSLIKYDQLGPNDVKEISGKKIIKWLYDSFDGFVMVLEDNTYLKMELSAGENYEHPSLMMEKLTLGDLWELGLIPEETWEEHLVEKRRLREAQDEVYGAQQLANAIDNLGIERVKEMVSKTAPED